MTYLLIKLRRCRLTAHCEIIVITVSGHTSIYITAKLAGRLNDETARVGIVTHKINALSTLQLVSSQHDTNLIWLYLLRFPR